MLEKTSDHDFKAQPARSSDSSPSVIEEANFGMDSEWTVAEEKAIRRKFDFTITPLVTVLCKPATPQVVYTCATLTNTLLSLRHVLCHRSRKHRVSGNGT